MHEQSIKHNEKHFSELFNLRDYLTQVKATKSFLLMQSYCFFLDKHNPWCSHNQTNQQPHWSEPFDTSHLHNIRMDLTDFLKRLSCLEGWQLRISKSWFNIRSVRKLLGKNILLKFLHGRHWAGVWHCSDWDQVKSGVTPLSLSVPAISQLSLISHTANIITTIIIHIISNIFYIFNCR